MIKRLAFLAALLWPLAGFAQSYTPAQLAAIAEADAQQYGVPEQLFVDQITAESDWNPSAVNGQTGATGIAQFLPSTAADPGYGIASFDPTDPVAALAAAAQYDAALYAADGDNWVAALTQYSGGLTPANPGDYGTVFEDAEGTNCSGTLSPDCGLGLGPATGTTATAGGGGLTVSTADTGTGSTAATTLAGAAAASGATAPAGAALSPFTYLWTQFSTGIEQPLQAEVTQIETTVAPYLNILLILMLIAMGTTTWLGRMRAGDFLSRAIRMSVVIGFTAVGSTYYQQYVVDLFGSLPTAFSNGILGATSTNPASGFDIVLHTFNSEVPNVNWNLPWGITTGIIDAIIIGICAFIVYLGVSLMFLAWIVAQALLQILLTLGPIVILALLFDYMRGWFDRWISAMLLMALITLATDLVSSIVLKVIQGYLKPMVSTGQASQDAFNLAGVAIVVMVLSSAVALLPVVLQFIAAAVGAPSMNAARNLIAGGASAAAKAATRGAAGAAVSGTKALLS